MNKADVINENLMVTSASRELAPCCRALLKDTKVFSGASCSREDRQEDNCQSLFVWE